MVNIALVQLPRDGDPGGFFTRVAFPRLLDILTPMAPMSSGVAQTFPRTVMKGEVVKTISGRVGSYSFYCSNCVFIYFSQDFIVLQRWKMSGAQIRNQKDRFSFILLGLSINRKLPVKIVTDARNFHFTILFIGSGIKAFDSLKLISRGLTTKETSFVCTVFFKFKLITKKYNNNNFYSFVRNKCFVSL